MRDYVLLLLALVLFIPIFIFGHLIHLFKGASMRKYAFNIALHLDETGGAMLFNSDDHTISAMVWEKDIKWAIKLIDWVFRDDTHCMRAWEAEF